MIQSDTMRVGIGYCSGIQIQSVLMKLGKQSFLLVLAMVAADAASAMALLTNDVENLRANATSIRQAGLVDVIQAPSEDGSGESKEYGICNVATMYGFTKGKLLPVVQVGIVGRIAIEHLNSGNGSIIPEIEGLNERCNIRFTNEMVDTMTKADIAIDKFVDLNERESKRPCAIITGPDASGKRSTS